MRSDGRESTVLGHSFSSLDKQEGMRSYLLSLTTSRDVSLAVIPRQVQTKKLYSSDAFCFPAGAEAKRF